MKRQQPKNQLEKFIQTAKEHGCDEDEKDFAEKLKKLAKSKKKPAK